MRLLFLIFVPRAPYPSTPTPPLLLFLLIISRRRRPYPPLHLLLPPTPPPHSLSTCRSICVTINLFIWPFQSIYLSIYRPISPYIYLSTYLSFFLSPYLSFVLSPYLSFCLSPIFLSIYLFTTCTHGSVYMKEKEKVVFLSYYA